VEFTHPNRKRRGKDGAPGDDGRVGEFGGNDFEVVRESALSHISKTGRCGASGMGILYTGRLVGQRVSGSASQQVSESAAG
jgi:hypothetical protein